MNKHRTVIKIGGESGQGLNSIGEILALALKHEGFKAFGYREYPSLIKGGYSNYQIDFSDIEINSSSTKCDLAISISRFAMHNMIWDLNQGGILVHCINKFDFKDVEKSHIERNNIKVVYVDTKSILMKLNGPKILENAIMVGFAWGILNQKIDKLNYALERSLASKKDLVDINKKALLEGYNYPLSHPKFEINFKKEASWKDSYLLEGNKSMSLGAIAAGVRAFYSYPMTPASSILEYLAEWSGDTKMIVKQAEDEITAAQMTLGSQHMGTRALVGTSGGGFDLMTESLSMAAMTEIPFVCIIGQRPGPATGLPTWTASADLNLAVYSGHGEYVRCVLAASDVESSYILIQKAFNIAEKYQIPVLVLTEKQIAESVFNVRKLPEALKIERGMVNKGEVQSNDRYKITETGISARWMPGESNATFNANTDEHFNDGRLTEDAEESRLMMEKRMKKEKFLLDDLEEPVLYGDEDSDILFVGWGSVKNAVIDVQNIIKQNKNSLKVSYLHYENVYPIKTEKLMNLVNKAKRVVLIENNYTGQLGNLIKLASGYDFSEKLLKYNGRAFFVEDILDYLGLESREELVHPFSQLKI